MKNKVLKTIALVIAAHFSFQLTAQIMTKNAPTYPATRKDPSVSDDYHGTKVADPYRWLEDDNAAETKEWVKKQNEVTFGYLEKILSINAIGESSRLMLTGGIIVAAVLLQRRK